MDRISRIEREDGAIHAAVTTCALGADAKVGAQLHSFEELVYVLESEIAFSADGVERLLAPGDVGFAPVGCIHAYENRSAARCRWLESQSPLPPARNGTRFA